MIMKLQLYSKKSKGVRLNWKPLKEARKEKLLLKKVVGNVLTKEDLEKRRGSVKQVRLLIP